MGNVWRIIKLSKPLHGLVALIGFLILFSSALQLVAPVLSKFIVDEITANVSSDRGDLNRLMLLIVIAFLANLAGVLTTTISDRLGDHFAGKLRKYLTEKFYDKVLSLPQSYFDLVF